MTIFFQTQLTLIFKLQMLQSDSLMFRVHPCGFKFQSLDVTMFALHLVRQEVEFINMETKVLWAPEGGRV